MEPLPRRNATPPTTATISSTQKSRPDQLRGIVQRIAALLALSGRLKAVYERASQDAINLEA